MNTNETRSLDEIVRRSLASDAPSKEKKKLDGHITICLTKEDQARFDKLNVGRQFCKTLRELILAAIEMTEARAS